MHIDCTIRYPHLHHYIQNISPPSPPSHIIYALINTLHPLINKCNNNIFTRSQNEEIDWTINLLNTLKSLHNSPETHINTTHPHTQFLEQNQKLTHPKIIIHDDLYKFLHQQNPPTLIKIKNEFPFLPDNFINEILKCSEPIPAYTHPPNNNYTPPNPQIPNTSQ